MCQDAYECVCLFQTILNNGKFTKYPARFKGESNRNLSEDFTISIEDVICIALSKQDDYCRSRPCITSEETVMQLLFHHYRSSRYIIWRLSYRYYPRGRYKLMHREKNSYLARRIMHSGIMHRGIMHRGNHASRVIKHARREDFMPRQNLCIARRLHTSLKFIHREKDLCLAGIHA